MAGTGDAARGDRGGVNWLQIQGPVAYIPRMSAALAFMPPRTLEEFLDWELHQDARFEWDGTQPIAMTGGSFAHTELASRVYDALRAALRNGPCTVIRTDLRVLTARGTRARYPDLVVTCSRIRADDQSVPDPVLILEVLSESTAGTDRGVKRAEYAALPSLARYVMLAQDAAIAVICDSAGGFEERQEHVALDMPEFGLRLPLADLYAGLLDAA